MYIVYVWVCACVGVYVCFCVFVGVLWVNCREKAKINYLAS